MSATSTSAARCSRALWETKRGHASAAQAHHTQAHSADTHSKGTHSRCTQPEHGKRKLRGGSHSMAQSVTGGEIRVYGGNKGAREFSCGQRDLCRLSEAQPQAGNSME